MRRRPLNEGRGGNPGDTSRRATPIPSCGTLNEGRGGNPGDTTVATGPWAVRTAAQRRPGRKPRRHIRNKNGLMILLERSTKAGAETPATHDEGAGHPSLDTRSTKAGAETPATRGGTERTRLSPCSLNEGRGGNPGDTPSAHPHHAGRRDRSTKAGAETPATPAPPIDTPHLPPRSTKAGAETPATLELHSIHIRSCYAQRRPGRKPRRHLRIDARRIADRPRSTKAGAETPATPLFCHGKAVSAKTVRFGGLSRLPGDASARDSTLLERSIQ